MGKSTCTTDNLIFFWSTMISLNSITNSKIVFRWNIDIKRNGIFLRTSYGLIWWYNLFIFKNSGESFGRTINKLHRKIYSSYSKPINHEFFVIMDKTLSSTFHELLYWHKNPRPDYFRSDESKDIYTSDEVLVFGTV